MDGRTDIGNRRLTLCFLSLVLVDCFWLGLQLCFEPPYNGVAVGTGIFFIVVRNDFWGEKDVRTDPQARNELIHWVRFLLSAL